MLKWFAEIAAFKQSFHSPLDSNMLPFICLMAGPAVCCEAMTDGYLRRTTLETTFSEKFSWMLFLRTYQHLSIRHKPLLSMALYQIAECGYSAGGCHMFKRKKTSGCGQIMWQIGHLNTGADTHFAVSKHDWLFTVDWNTHYILNKSYVIDIIKYTSSVAIIHLSWMFAGKVSTFNARLQKLMTSSQYAVSNHHCNITCAMWILLVRCGFPFRCCCRPAFLCAPETQTPTQQTFILISVFIPIIFFCQV